MLTTEHTTSNEIGNYEGYLTQLDAESNIKQVQLQAWLFHMTCNDFNRHEINDRVRCL